MKTVRITAKTIDAAVEEGLKQLGISREEAIVHVVEQPSSGLFGLIHKKMAVVDITDPEDKPEAAVETPEEKAEATEEVTVETAETEEVTEERAPEADAAEEKAETSEAPSEKKKADEFVFNPEEQEKTAEEAKAFLENVFKGMHLSVTMERMMNEERILINLRGEGLGILIGKHGQTLDALQYLTNLAAGKAYHHHYFVLLDVENYRERRKATLEALARRLAGKVRRTGEPVELEPMSAAERRIIHLALQADGAVTTESEGEAPHRYVVIKLKD